MKGWRKPIQMQTWLNFVNYVFFIKFLVVHPIEFW